MNHVVKAPFDVIESILKEVETCDLQNVLKADKTFLNTSNRSKALWIVHAQKLLKRYRHLDLMPAKSLNDYSIENLKIAVLNATTLEENWTSERPKIVAISEEGEPLESYERVTKIWKLSDDRVLLHTEKRNIRIFDIQENVVVAIIHYRDGVLIRDCVTECSEDAMHVFCLIGMDPYKEFHDYHAYVHEPDETTWNYILLRIDLPFGNSKPEDPSSTKFVEVSKFKCPGRFEYGAILDVPKKLVAIITRTDDDFFVNILQDDVTGSVCSLAVNFNFSSGTIEALTLSFAAELGKILFYDSSPNKIKMGYIDIQYSDAERPKIHKVGELQMQLTHSWNEMESAQEPFINGENLICYQTFQSSLNIYSSKKPLTCISTAYILQVTPRLKSGGYFSGDASFVLVQYYSSYSAVRIDPTENFAHRCMTPLRNAQQIFNHDRRSHIPLIDITFNHAAWIESSDIGIELKLATFLPPWEGEDGESLQSNFEAHVVTLEIPTTDKCLHKRIDRMAQRLVIDEARGAIIVHTALNSLFTVYYA